jgi:hypothetical protein
MIDLEALLKQALPEVQFSKSSEIETLINGFFVDDEKLVFVREIKRDLLQSDSLKIPKLISAYCQLPENDSKNFLFIDTETTGLAGGAGTIAFVVGIGFLQEDCFLIRQYFLKNQDGEEALLHDLNRYLQRFNTFVSYNGKSFDIPLLQTRFIMNQLPFPSQSFGHIDLLHIVRRLWKYCLADCSLQTVENQILQMKRNNKLEIPGAAIPQEYFFYLETGDASAMKRVLEHNETDIYSLYLIVKHVFSYLNEISFLKNEDAVFSVAKWFEDCNLEAEAAYFYEMIADKHEMGRKQLSFLYKRREEWEKAVIIWQKSACFREEYALIELAKYEEHRAKQLDAALDWTDKALESLQKKAFFLPEELEALQHRRQRILAKMK